MFRRPSEELEVFLVHAGGPFWANKDAGAWMIPKGEYVDGELPLDAARREFHEETGFEAKGNSSIWVRSGRPAASWSCMGL